MQTVGKVEWHQDKDEDGGWEHKEGRYRACHWAGALASQASLDDGIDGQFYSGQDEVQCSTGQPVSANVAFDVSR